jgi:hypothetical protein
LVDRALENLDVQRRREPLAKLIPESAILDREKSDAWGGLIGSSATSLFVARLRSKFSDGNAAKL